ncbi:MAG: hypothetical protein FWG36_07235 [Oscillospiraceae bacterium]|nr:hypothetical protein [Oscillospiraceae bacterium]
MDKQKRLMIIWWSICFSLTMIMGVIGGVFYEEDVGIFFGGLAWIAGIIAFIITVRYRKKKRAILNVGNPKCKLCGRSYDFMAAAKWGAEHGYCSRDCTMRSKW